jgi:broad-specificity NMP kinase
MLRGYLACTWLEYVIFSYGFHGPRQKIWESVQANLKDIPYILAPITIRCEPETLIGRMLQDGRDPERIQRALEAHDLYEHLPYPRIDTTRLTVEETVERVLEIVLRKV